MIIGLDIQTELGLLYINTAEKTAIDWDEHNIPMKTHRQIGDKVLLHQLYHMSKEPALLQEAELKQSGSQMLIILKLT